MQQVPTFMTTARVAVKSYVFAGAGEVKARLDDVFRKPVLMTAIEVGRFGQLFPHKTEWSQYWRPVEILRRKEISTALAQLRHSWEKYIDSGFEWELIQSYCLSYFVLLETLNALANSGDPRYRRALATVVGFENFGIVEPATGYSANAAATTTARNPVYLLARLKWPKVRHSTRFLPLIALANNADFSLFGQYRRYSVSDTSDLSVMIYPRNVQGGDLESLSSLGRLIKALGSSTDPFASERAERLWEYVVKPLAMPAINVGNLRSVEVLDIGSSTGAVVGKVLANLIEESDMSAPRIKVSLVDSSPALLSQEFADPELRAQLDNVEMIESDYREWLDRVPSRPPEDERLRIAFACKVFDMASSFEIKAFRQGDLPSPPAESDWFDEDRRAVTKALAPGMSPHDRVLTSSYRFAIDEGHVIAQPALSSYFEALQRISTDSYSQQNDLRFPVRIADPASLLTLTGKSGIEAVLQDYDYLVIEDADLRPSDLVRHLDALDSRDVSALDLTATMRLTGNYAYILWKKNQNAPKLDGVRLA